ncbi:probable trehalose-phosphate phosphatase F [Impatiens glandulifera]|uniref:probable trehalose-phosphate phosphatase F n=1 Tax=Impatiens glandulifera TaxID=253017 RepID=UPI001FB0BF5F|nr:probable trehalose-phosphate phosphatase F [Impatiens glandulifera]
MDLNSTSVSPVITDPAPIHNSMLGINSSLLPYSQSGVLTKQRKRPIKLDDVRSNGWLDAMQSSSPSRKKIIDDIEFAIPLEDSEDSDISYESWLLKYPPALNSFQHIMDQAGSKKVVIFLDYDGTLSPIVDDPDRAFISDNMRNAVRNVAKYFLTAIISGRRRDKVHDLVGLSELYYAGSHGMDIMVPVNDKLPAEESTNQQGREVNLFQPAREFIPMIDEVFRTFVTNTKSIKGAKVENHKFCASIHYRNVDEKSWQVMAQCVYDILKEYPRLRLTHGRKVLEVRPAISWDKGKAVEFMLESLGCSQTDDVLALYIGDDKTDEDAFKILRERNLGYGILVSPNPKESSASFSLKDPSEVEQFLESLVRWKEEKEMINTT